MIENDFFRKTASVPDHALIGITMSEILDNALISQDVYNDTQQNYFMGWHRIFDSVKPDENGYFGAAYINNLEKPGRMIIAHRGTDSIQDIVEDISIIRDKTFSQLDSAVNFIKTSLNYIYELYNSNLCSDIMINHTGHSLGAIIADVMMAYFSNEFLSLTFENPGSFKIINDFMKSKSINYRLIEKQFIAVQAHPNLINSCNEQAGTIFRMVNLPYDFSLIPDLMLDLPFFIPEKWEFNPYYSIAYTLNQHKIEGIVDYLKNNGILRLDTEYSGLKNGYNDYLDTKVNANYWRQYFIKAWEHQNSWTIKKDDMIAQGFKAVDEVRAKGMENES